MNAAAPKDVGLFVTCLVDLFRPSVGFAAVRLLEHAGCRVHVPAAQTCCGQPGYNGGDFDSARVIARQVIAAFAGFDYVVAPSGSCTGMIKTQYTALFQDDEEMQSRARDLADRTFELTSFLVDVMAAETVPSDFVGTIAYHDSCAGLRELGVKAQPRKLLGSIAGAVLCELAESEVCCGFGGTFCVKYPDISVKMASDKVADALATGADYLAAGDLGCLMNLAGRLQRLGHDIEVRHVAEILAGMTDAPAIGAPPKS